MVSCVSPRRGEYRRRRGGGNPRHQVSLATRRPSPLLTSLYRMAGITTHVLDTAAGRPAAGIPLTLEFREDSTIVTLVETTTDDDGRANLSDGSTLAEGRYRIRFDTGAYHGDTAFFPEVTIEFLVTDVDDHHHLPLLLSPFGYSTYRGS